MKDTVIYKGWVIEFDPPPIPSWCGCDFAYYHPDNHNGPEDNWSGSAASVDQAIERIEDFLSNRE